MKKYTTPVMVGLVTLGMAGGMATTLVSQNVFAAESLTTATTEANTITDTERETKRAVMDALHDAAQSSLEAGDYTAWSAKMNEIAETMYQDAKAGITESNFSVLQQMKTAEDSGDFEKARELSQQLSGPVMMGRMHKGGPRGGHMGMFERKMSTQSQAEDGNEQND